MGGVAFPTTNKYNPNFLLLSSKNYKFYLSETTLNQQCKDFLYFLRCKHFQTKEELNKIEFFLVNRLSFVPEYAGS